MQSTNLKPPMEAKIRRQQTMVDTRRAMVLAAAKAVFTQLGLERSSIREIAKRAGYTPGAIYAYFPSKQELFAALLEESMHRVDGVIAQARPIKGRPHALLQARAQAWFSFFATHSRDLELTLFLLAGSGLQGMAPELSQRLHARLRQTLDPCVAALQTLGADPAQAHAEREALLAHGLGLLMVQSSASLTAPETSAQALFVQYLDRLAERFETASVSAITEKTAIPPQVDLFS
ncbi:hypothetical protein RS694_11445 [Rhodoferax saidenbachensis]|uniref:HTH tetR-type domain-containing protein n=2 Tax=Rhodoferax saidenbachensis TaxID=1484693 RepID=A0A1P8KAQ1_9BURK|nr:hypothetical protein RS694_11445 [Rhodoferax saidenbachensis]